MASKEFILQRICIYAGQIIDPNSDSQVEEILLRKFNIHLPQRRSMNESITAAISTHEILSLIIQYRTIRP